MGISSTQERYVNFYTDSAFNKKELHDYRESQKDFWDLNSVIETAERKGFTKGEKKGIEKGSIERQVSIARSLKLMGILSVNQIAEATGLAEEDISKL